MLGVGLFVGMLFGISNSHAQTISHDREHQPSTYDLLHMIQEQPEPLKRLAWQEYLVCLDTEAAKDPSFTPNSQNSFGMGEELGLIIFDAPEPYKALAWSKLLSQGGLTGYYLRAFAAYAPEPYSTKAREELLRQDEKADLYHEGVHYVLWYGSVGERARAAEKVLGQRDPEDYNLQQVLSYAPEPYKAEAWDRLSERKVNNECCGIAQVFYDDNIPLEYKEKAAVKLLETLTESNLEILAHVAPEPYKTTAKKLLQLWQNQE